MTHHPKLAALLALALAGVYGAQARSAESVVTAGAIACSIAGWSNDPDPAGLNVRAAPSTTAKIIGRIPPSQAQAGDTYGAEFDIVGSRDGWFLIRNARFADYGGGKGDRVLFRGPGWVFADKVRFLINSADLRSAPSLQAPVVARLRSPDGSSGPDSAIIDHVYGCASDFAEVAVHMSNKPPTRGWATRICSNQVATCP
jgi:hypothetical protein